MPPGTCASRTRWSTCDCAQGAAAGDAGQGASQECGQRAVQSAGAVNKGGQPSPCTRATKQAASHHQQGRQPHQPRSKKFAREPCKDAAPHHAQLAPSAKLAPVLLLASHLSPMPRPVRPTMPPTAPSTKLVSLKNSLHRTHTPAHHTDECCEPHRRQRARTLCLPGLPKPHTPKGAAGKDC